MNDKFEAFGDHFNSTNTPNPFTHFGHKKPMVSQMDDPNPNGQKIFERFSQSFLSVGTDIESKDTKPSIERKGFFESQQRNHIFDTTEPFGQSNDSMSKWFENIDLMRANGSHNWSNGSDSGQVSDLHIDNDFKGSPPKRPILKTERLDINDKNDRNERNDRFGWNEYKASLIHTSAPSGPNSYSNSWYDTYAQQTQRFPKSNGKHVRFAHDFDDMDSDIENRGTDLGLFDGFPNSFTPGSVYRPKDSSPPMVYSFPRLDSIGQNTSIVDSILPAVKKVQSVYQRNIQYATYKWGENANNIKDRINNSLNNNNSLNTNNNSTHNNLFLDQSNIWSNPVSNPVMNLISSANESKDLLQQMMTKMKINTTKEKPSYTWSGQLPRRVRTKTPIYSCKVFLGGIPYDLTDSDLHCTFAQFGHIQIQWPGKDIKSAIDGAAANKAGYVYIIFESYDNVAALLGSCTISYRDVDSGCRWFFNISSRRQKGKEVQVIPFDIGDRFYLKAQFSGQMEHSRTVFVGALHGMLSADGLAKVMDDLFGGVVFAGLDTDKHKYPLGSGRVSFDNQDSYLKAVLANFVEIKSNRFKKKIQIDPYIENESVCANCRLQQSSPIFCRDCFVYYCPQCWELNHSEPENRKHRPIIKNKPANA